MKLFDIKKNKDITIKHFDLSIKRLIIDGKLKPKIINTKFKELLSTDDNVIPLYDISNNKLFFVKKKNIYYLIKENYFRPLSEKLIKFIQDNNLNENGIIEIINYFDFHILENILLKFIYYNTKEVAGDLTYLRNPAYINFLNINPYLKKSSITNTALNMQIITIDELPISSTKLYSLYHKITQYLFNSDEILSHLEHITHHKMSKIINFYTLYGSYFLNNYIRNPKYYDENYELQINKITNLIRSSPKLDSDKVIFRYLQDDSFLKVRKKGDIYIENSFMSCTRKPNLTTSSEFGFILLKIHLPSNMEGCCLFLEGDSVFKDEKEIILGPGSRLKLLSIDDNVEFYVFDKNLQRNIRKKYEFQYMGNEHFDLNNILKNARNYEHKFTLNKTEVPRQYLLGGSLNPPNIQNIDLILTSIEGNNLEDKIDYFWENFGRKYRRFNLNLPNGDIKLMYCNYYNSTEIYGKFFQYKINDGFFMYSFNEHQEIDLFIEIGDKIIVNFPSKFLSIKPYKETLLLASIIGYSFRINVIDYYPEFVSVFDTDKIIASRLRFNKLLLNLINKEKQYKISDHKIILDYLNSKPININYNLQKYNPVNSYIDLIKKVIKEKNIIDIKFLLISLPNKIINSHYEIYPYEFLLNKKYIINAPNENIKYINRRALKSPEFFSLETNFFRKIS